MYYLGGDVLTLEDVKVKMPDEKILISNMENNGHDRIIINKMCPSDQWNRIVDMLKENGFKIVKQGKT